MTERFTLDWLDLREPHDALARSDALAAQLIARLPARPRLLDLGAGTGSLFRWLAPRIARAQAWTLVDSDPAMIEAAFETIADRAEGIGLRITFPAKRTMLVHAPGGAWRVEALVADLAHIPGRLPLANQDAVVCTALCDLVSRRWLDRLAATLRVPFYAALNGDGHDHILPRDPADARVLAAFRRDQSRDKGFGPALGIGAPAAIAAAFTARGFSVASARSDWRIRAGDHPMLSHLILDLVQAANRRHHAHRGAVGRWLHRRQAMAEAGRTAIRIGHRDLLAPAGEPPMNLPFSLAAGLTLSFEAKPAEADLEILPHGLEAFNVLAWPDHVLWHPMHLFVREGSTVLAGLAGDSYAGWLHIRYLWVAERLRRQGIGSLLLAEAETRARSQGSHSAWLDTFSFQGPLFYPKHGYIEFARLPHPPTPHERIFFRKTLTST